MSKEASTSHIANQVVSGHKKLHPGLSPEHFVQWLDERVGLLVNEIGASTMWAEITSPDADPAFVHAFMKEVYLEIFFYNQHIVEATFAIIGQLPRTLEIRALKAMLRHQAEEFDHGEMALRDYVGMGGNEEEARRMRLSPGAFAASGMWLMLARMRDPFAYLGAEYLFENLTPILAESIQPFLTKKGMTSKSLEFIQFHAEEDPKHARLMQELIRQVVEQYPSAMESIAYGYDCFEFVYPIPVWRCAYQRALETRARKVGIEVPLKSVATKKSLILPQVLQPSLVEHSTTTP